MEVHSGYLGSIIIGFLGLIYTLYKGWRLPKYFFSLVTIAIVLHMLVAVHWYFGMLTPPDELRNVMVVRFIGILHLLILFFAVYYVAGARVSKNKQGQLENAVDALTADINAKASA